MTAQAAPLAVSDLDTAMRRQDEGPARQIVCAFADDGRISGLLLALSGLGYEAVDGRSGVPDGCLAAVVCGAYDPDLALSRVLKNRVRVVLADAAPSFARRLAVARAGIEAIIATPVDTVELGAWLSDFETSGDRQQRLSILIVDDDELIAESYALALEAAGMDARVVTYPADALRHIAEVTPDLVLLDMHMPGASGLELAQIIRQSRQTLPLPIVFLSAERDIAAQTQARQIGGDDFIRKPVDLAHLAATVRMRAERALALRQIMERDSLTGLLNHARFKERVTLELARSRRTGAPLTVALIDIDHFKPVNDTHGHQTGDRVIQALSQCLVGGLRRTDVVARYGGEEFGLLLLDTPVAAAQAVLDRIRLRFSQIGHAGDDTLFRATFSGGIAGTREGTDSTAMIAAADAALYGAKRAGRNRITGA
ncbi:GGDEF domain-containing protein [Aurantimonas coralicida]|uniref:GGDEF domain-containing protein n=1 Tax=Aurantimonas coralicida TaxID=182270 RepID=UPI0035168468